MHNKQFKSGVPPHFPDKHYSSPSCIFLMSLAPSQRGTVSQHPLPHSSPYRSHSVVSAPCGRKAGLLSAFEIELMGHLGVETAEMAIPSALLSLLTSLARLRAKLIEGSLPRKDQAIQEQY